MSGATDPARARTRTGSARWVAYAVVGVIGVVLVLLFWSSIDRTGPGSVPAVPAASPDASEGAPRAGATDGPDDVVTSEGDRYLLPTVTLRSSTLIVTQPVEVRASTGPVDVPAPTLGLLVGGVEAAPRTTGTERDSLRADGGALVAFDASFAAETSAGAVDVGDEVTVRVTAGDSTTHDVAGVLVEDGRRYAH